MTWAIYVHAVSRAVVALPGGRRQDSIELGLVDVVGRSDLQIIGKLRANRSQRSSVRAVVAQPGNQFWRELLPNRKPESQVPATNPGSTGKRNFRCSRVFLEGSRSAELDLRLVSS